MELDLYGLAVCAIMSSGELDAEGLTTLALAGGGGGSAGSAAGAMAQVCPHKVFPVSTFLHGVVCAFSAPITRKIQVYLVIQLY